MACASWRPVSLQDPQPYYPTYELPTNAELEAMDWKEFNEWRAKAKRLLLAYFQKLWRYKGFTDCQYDQLIAIYRKLRKAIFGDEDYGCNFHGKRKWDLSIDVAESWKLAKPIWYKE